MKWMRMKLSALRLQQLQLSFAGVKKIHQVRINSKKINPGFVAFYDLRRSSGLEMERAYSEGGK